MEKIKIKLDAVKTLLNYVLIVLFGASSYVFINSDKLSGFKIIVCSILSAVMLIVACALVAVYISILRRL